MENIWKQVVDFMQQDLVLMDNTFKMWMAFAAGAGLILIVLVIILITTRKKRKKTPDNVVQMEGIHTMMDDDSSAQSPKEDEQPQILSIGDEPTVNLEEMSQNNGIVVGADDVTTDMPIETTVKKTQYLVQVQMHYGDLVAEARPILTESTPIVFGRGEGPEVTVRTNPSDTSVSHRHGTIYLQNDLPWYRDDSRNGTILNGARTLHSGDTAQLAVQTKIQLELGTHRVLLFIIRQA